MLTYLAQVNAAGKEQTKYKIQYIYSQIIYIT